MLVRLGRWLKAPSVHWRRRVCAGGAECALAAPSVHWRRRVCAGGAECALEAADRGGYRPTDTLKAVTAHSIRRHHSRLGKHVRHPPNACHHKRFERRCGIGVPKTGPRCAENRARHPSQRTRTSLTSSIHGHHEFPSEAGSSHTRRGPGHPRTPGATVTTHDVRLQLANRQLDDGGRVEVDRVLPARVDRRNRASRHRSRHLPAAAGSDSQLENTTRDQHVHLVANICHPLVDRAQQIAEHHPRTMGGHHT